MSQQSSPVYIGAGQHLPTASIPRLGGFYGCEEGKYSFLSHIRIADAQIIQKADQRRSSSITTVGSQFSNSIDSLGVEGSITLSFLGGILSIGAGIGIGFDKNSIKNHISIGKQSMMVTRTDQINLPWTAGSAKAKSRLLETLRTARSNGAKHVVVSVTYGHFVELTMDFSNVASKAGKRIKFSGNGSISLVIASVQAGASVEFENMTGKSDSSLNVTVRTSIPTVGAFVRNDSELMAAKGQGDTGKGKDVKLQKDNSLADVYASCSQFMQRAVAEQLPYAGRQGETVLAFSLIPIGVLIDELTNPKPATDPASAGIRQSLSTTFAHFRSELHESGLVLGALLTNPMLDLIHHGSKDAHIVLTNANKLGDELQALMTEIAIPSDDSEMSAFVSGMIDQPKDSVREYRKRVSVVEREIEALNQILSTKLELLTQCRYHGVTVLNEPVLLSKEALFASLVSIGTELHNVQWVAIVQLPTPSVDTATDISFHTVQALMKLRSSVQTAPQSHDHILIDVNFLSSGETTSGDDNDADAVPAGDEDRESICGLYCVRNGRFHHVDLERLSQVLPPLSTLVGRMLMSPGDSTTAKRLKPPPPPRYLRDLTVVITAPSALGTAPPGKPPNALEWSQGSTKDALGNVFDDWVDNAQELLPQSQRDSIGKLCGEVDYCTWLVPVWTQHREEAAHSVTAHLLSEDDADIEYDTEHTLCVAGALFQLQCMRTSTVGKEEEGPSSNDSSQPSAEVAALAAFKKEVADVRHLITDVKLQWLPSALLGDTSATSEAAVPLVSPEQRKLIAAGGSNSPPFVAVLTLHRLSWGSLLKEEERCSGAPIPIDELLQR